MARLSAQAPSGGGRVTLPRVAVIGAGSIGTSWAIVFARGGHPVAVHDPDAERLASAVEEIAARLAALEGAGLLAEAGPEVAARVTMHDQLAAALVGAVRLLRSARLRGIAS